jgi:hypothetical protein
MKNEVNWVRAALAGMVRGRGRRCAILRHHHPHEPASPIAFSRVEGLDAEQAADLLTRLR